MKKTTPAVLVAAMLLVTVLAGATIRPAAWTARQTAAHEAAEILRAAGVEEEHESIQALKGLWWSEHVEAPEMSQDVPSCTTVSQDVPATETPIWDAVGISWEDYCTMCYTDMKEAGSGDTENELLLQRATAAVLWNRVRDDHFPDTVTECVAAPGQYNPSYVTDSLDGIPQANVDAVNDVLSGAFTLPADCVWQALFTQGTYTHMAISINSDGYKSTTYICGGFIYG